MKKLFLFLTATLFSIGTWATDWVRLDSIDFTNTSKFPAVTYTNQSATVQGVFFKAKSSKNVKVNNSTAGVDFDGTNLGSGDHGIAIPVTDVNGSLKVIVYHDMNNSSATYRVGVAHADNNDPSKTQTFDLTPTNSGGVKNANDFIMTKSGLSGTAYIVWAGESSSSYKVIKRIAIYTEAPSCDDPESTIKADTTLYVGDSYNIGFNSINTNGCSIDVKKDGVAAIDDEDYEKAGVNDYTFLTAGEFVITISQAADAGGHCAVEESVTVTVNAKTPVTSVAIDGPASGYIGDKLTYTATANATQYQWWLDGVQQGSDSAKFIYTAAKGNHSIVCKARNNFNEVGEWIPSSAKAVTITKACGELIRATRNGKNLDPVTGVVGGTADKNTQDGGKLGSNGHYWKLTLASGNFMVTDTVIVNVSTAGGQGTITITSDKAGADVLGTLGGVGTTGDNKVILTKGGVNTIWLSRDGTNNTYNGVVDAIYVKRPCTESSDATIASLTVKGEAASKEGNTYSYQVGSSDVSTEVTVAYTLNHPLATATPASGFTIDVPDAGDPANTRTITVTAEDGTEVEYTVSVTKAASASTDATLSALTVDGYTLDPVFAPATTEYSISIAYGTKVPAKSKITATPNDANATSVEIDSVGNVFTITVTAEDGVATQDYTITVDTLAAKKDLLRATFSNGAIGYISGSNINVPYLAGEDEPTFTSTTFWNADGEPTAEVVAGDLVVTGADSKTTTYTITYVPVTPMELSYDEVTFTAVPSYIHSVYAWDADKGVKFAKDVEESSNHRISEGKDRIYIALPAAGKVILTSGNQGARPVRITVNGAATSITNLAAKNEAIEVRLSKSNANLVGIESNGSNGDGGIIKLQLGADYPTALDNTVEETKAVKFIENGQVVIFKDGKYFNVLGIQIR